MHYEKLLHEQHPCQYYPLSWKL